MEDITNLDSTEITKKVLIEGTNKYSGMAHSEETSSEQTIIHQSNSNDNQAAAADIATQQDEQNRDPSTKIEQDEGEQQDKEKLSEEEKKSKSQKDSEDSFDHNDDFEFDMDRIKERASQMSASHLPKWFIESDTSTKIQGMQVDHLRKSLSKMQKSGSSAVTNPNEEGDQAEEEEVEEKEKEKSDDDDDDDFEFDMEKIKQAAARASNLPKWLLDADVTLNQYNSKVEEVKVQLNDLGKGLKHFDDKRSTHETKVKQDEVRLSNLRTNNPIARKQALDEMKYRSNFYLINDHLLLRIVEYVSQDLIGTLLKMSRVSRRYWSLLQSETVWTNIAHLYLGHQFLPLNDSEYDSLSNNCNGNTVINASSYSTNRATKLTAKRVLQHFYCEFHRFRVCLTQYRNQNCPLVLPLPNQRASIITGLKFVNEVFSLVALNRHTNFRLYTALMEFLCDGFLKGAYCLSRLAQLSEETIRYDAFDALFAFLSCEPAQLQGFSVFHQVSVYINRSEFSFERKLKALLCSEINHLLLDRKQTSFYVNPSMFFPSILYNSRFSLSTMLKDVSSTIPKLKGNTNTKSSAQLHQKTAGSDQFNKEKQFFDIQSNENDIAFINQFLADCTQESNSIINMKLKKGKKFSGILYERNDTFSKELRELKGEISLLRKAATAKGTSGNNSSSNNNSGGRFTIDGFGITSESKNFALNGNILFSQSTALRKKYDFQDPVAHFAEGSLTLSQVVQTLREIPMSLEEQVSLELLGSGNTERMVETNSVTVTQSFKIFATLTYQLAIKTQQTNDCINKFSVENGELRENKDQFITIYGATEDYREIIVLRID